MKGLPKALRDVLRMPRKSLPVALQSTIVDKWHKYHAIRTKCLYGHPHDSRKEAMWCLKLREEEKEGRIRNLSCEPVYDLRVNGIVVCTHLPDFDYEKSYGGIWKVEVLDAKGLLLPEWKLKYKLFQAIYPDIKYNVV